MVAHDAHRLAARVSPSHSAQATGDAARPALGGPRILVIEDHHNLAQVIKTNLQEIAVEVTLAYDGRMGLAYAESGRYDLLVLDLMLPCLDGIEICRRLRKHGSYLPILMVTARTLESDRVAGLDMGADDYLTKPFSVVELVARVKALLRRRNVFDADRAPHTSLTHTFKELCIDETRREVILRGERLDLTAKEFELLVLLAANPGKTFTRGQLLDCVWGHNFTGCESTLKTHINRLRNRIEDEPDDPHYILTVWGVGYRFADAEMAET